MINAPKPSKRSGRMSVLLERIKVGLLGEIVPDQPQKRIVSKAEYVRLQAKQAEKFIRAAFLLMIGLLCTAISGACILGIFMSPFAGICLVLALLFVIGAYIFLVRGFTSLNHWDKVEVVPLTRANTGHLPTVASLVRASQEPAQAQKAVLLRASTGGQEKHEEQLLRAVAGEQEQA